MDDLSVSASHFTLQSLVDGKDIVFGDGDILCD
jgi:hypothetical protein